MNIRQVLIGLIILCAVVFWIDPKIINFIMGLLTPDLSHSGIIRFITWCLLLWLTWRVTLWLSIALGYVLGAGGKRTKTNKLSGIKTGQKSKWAERLEEMQKMQTERLKNSNMNNVSEGMSTLHKRINRE